MPFSFSITPWFFLPFVAAGGWLAYALYFKSAGLPPRFWKWFLGAATLLAWIALAGLLVQPSWRGEFSIYHPPAIVLAVDESPSYAGGTALNSKSEVQAGLQRARKFYQDKGFRMLELEFGETVRDAGSRGDLGILTSFASLHRHLDSLAIPNLQGIFVWTDGRFNRAADVAEGAMPAPVFPVLIRGGMNDIQGEKVEADFSGPDSDADVSAEWRSLGGNATATLEIRSGARVLWNGALPMTAPASGEKARHRFRMPAPAFRGAGENWTALIRPGKKTDNVSEKNDTIPVHATGLHRKRQILLGPLRSLDERGLVDALFSSDSIEVITVPPEALEAELRKGGVLWARSSSESRAVAQKLGIPVILYSLPGESGGSVFFPAEARVAWREDAVKALPGGALNLSDLGVEEWRLRSFTPGLVPVAWAELGVRRGLLLAQHQPALNPVFEVSVPSLWFSRFRPGVDERIRRLQERWFQGVAEYARIQGRRERGGRRNLFRTP